MVGIMIGTLDGVGAELRCTETGEGAGTIQSTCREAVRVKRNGLP